MPLKGHKTTLGKLRSKSEKRTDPIPHGIEPLASQAIQEKISEVFFA